MSKFIEQWNIIDYARRLSEIKEQYDVNRKSVDKSYVSDFFYKGVMPLDMVVWRSSMLDNFERLEAFKNNLRKIFTSNYDGFCGSVSIMYLMPNEHSHAFIYRKWGDEYKNSIRLDGEIEYYKHIEKLREIGLINDYVLKDIFDDKFDIYNEDDDNYPTLLKCFIRFAICGKHTRTKYRNDNHKLVMCELIKKYGNSK